MTDVNQIQRRSFAFYVMIFFTVIGVMASVAVIFLMAIAIKFSVNMGSLRTGKTNNGTKYLPTTYENYIAAIKFNGQISAETTQEVLEKFSEIQTDKYAKAVLFDVSSPGGSVVPSQEIYDIIKEVRKQMPIFTYVRDMAASGAYYSIAPSTKIIANRGSLIGSIGVILSSFEITELLNWGKLKPITLKTGDLKDAGSLTRPWTDKDKVYLQKLINDTKLQFANDVKEARNLSDESINYMSDGRVVLGTEALELKLIDQLGSYNVAVNELHKELKAEVRYEVIYLEKRQDFIEELNTLLTSQTKINFRNEIKNIVRELINSTPEIK